MVLLALGAAFAVAVPQQGTAQYNGVGRALFDIDPPDLVLASRQAGQLGEDSSGLIVRATVATAIGAGAFYYTVRGLDGRYGALWLPVGLITVGVTASAEEAEGRGWAIAGGTLLGTIVSAMMLQGQGATGGSVITAFLVTLAGAAGGVMSSK